MSEFRNGLRGTLACACYTLRLRLRHNVRLRNFELPTLKCTYNLYGFSPDVNAFVSAQTALVIKCFVMLHSYELYLTSVSVCV